MTGLVILVVGIYTAWIWAELAVRWIVAHETPRTMVVVVDPDEVYDWATDDRDIRAWENELAEGEAS